MNQELNPVSADINIFVLSPDVVKNYLLIFSAIFLSITIFACLLRAILGPRFTDRVIAANIIGTKTIALISIMSLIVGEAYLVDICLIYAIISFMSVVILARSVIERKTGNANALNADAELDDTKREIMTFPYNYNYYIFQEEDLQP